MINRFELRRSIRIPVQVIASLWDEPLLFHTSDLTPQGAYVVSELMPQVGEQIVCSFRLSDMSCRRAQYCFFGEVARVNLFRRTAERGRPGFGVLFLDATPLERLRIRSILRGLPPPIPAAPRAISLKNAFGRNARMGRADMPFV